MKTDWPLLIMALVWIGVFLTVTTKLALGQDYPVRHPVPWNEQHVHSDTDEDCFKFHPYVNELSASKDTLELCIDENRRGTLTYLNHLFINENGDSSGSTVEGTFHIHHKGVTVTAEISFQGIDGREELKVLAPEFIVDPDHVFLPDGQQTEVELIWPMS